MKLKEARIALVFDWMTNEGGAEKVNRLLHNMFPNAPIFTSIFNREKVKGFDNANIKTSFIQSLPFAKNHHQIYLGFMPYAYELFDLSNFDIVISSSHACAKGVITKPETLHICYCHSPMRYAWDNWHSYIKEYKINSLVKRFAKKKLHKIRMWDLLSANRVDYFLANSSITKKRIEKYYRRPSTVLFPSIRVNDFSIAKETKGYFLAVGRLTPYKKFDLIVDVFTELGLPLKIVGRGIAERDLMSKAGPNIEFLGRVPDKQLHQLYSECEALIFPQVEDFGIVMLETMASGRPVIALQEGGALDAVIDERTGIFMAEQTSASLKEAIEKYQKIKKKFNPEKIRRHAEEFDEDIFKEKFLRYVKEKWQNRN